MATGELLGAHLIGAEVTELIQGFAIAQTLETTEAELLRTVFPHPTLSEAMHEAVLDAWGRLPAEVLPRDAARAVLRDVYRHGPAVRRDVLALRAVQSLAVLDVRNYRDLVFRIGEFEQGGEDPELGRALP